MNKILFVAVAVAATLLSGGAAAGDSRGTITYTGTETNGPFYLSCVGEFASVTVNYESRFHQFETTAGTVHILDNWSYTALYTSASGRQWIGHGVSPLHLNARMDKGSTVGFTSSSRMAPVDGAPNPSFIFKSNYKLTMNALGDVVVAIVPVPGENFTCLGPKN